MGFFGSGDKKQLTTNTQTGASESAQLGQGGSVLGKDEAVNLGGTLNTNVLGSQATGGGTVGDKGLTVGYGATSVIGGVEVKGANTGSITINEAAGLTELAKSFKDTIAQINSSASADKIEAQKLVGDALGSIAQLSESKQTEGITALGKLALWGLGLGLSALLIWKWSK